MKKQTEIGTLPATPITWKEDPDVGTSGEQAEVIKLRPDESIAGILMEVVESVKWPGKKIYKIKEKNSEVLKVIVGTTVLDKAMSVKKVGDLVMITRKPDQPSKKGQPTQIYKTSSPEQV
jgi:hypothetical protein